jgi:hypothetical protein
MAGIRLLAPENRVSGVHPPQSGVCPEIRPLALESAYCCIDDDSVVLTSALSQ